MAAVSVTFSSPSMGGTIIKVESAKSSYSVGKAGVVKGAGELTDFDRTGNTYGMKAWVHIGTGAPASEGFFRPVAAPKAAIT